MGFNFNNDLPIYLQIVEQIKRQIISGKYKPNDRIPSVRELSMQFEVNPNTVQKALAELEELGLIYTERTNGKFVTSDVNIIEKIKKETVYKMISKFKEDVECLGLGIEEVVKLFFKE